LNYIFIYFDICFFFFSSRRRHTRFSRDWSSDVCSSDLRVPQNQNFWFKTVWWQVLYQLHKLPFGTGIRALKAINHIEDLLWNSVFHQNHFPGLGDRFTTPNYVEGSFGIPNASSQEMRDSKKKTTLLPTNLRHPKVQKRQSLPEDRSSIRIAGLSAVQNLEPRFPTSLQTSFAD